MPSLKLEVTADDGGPVDAHHVTAVALLNAGADLDAIATALRKCPRPARVALRIGKLNLPVVAPKEPA